ncbi:MAG: TonB C-terminal domain-containing protein [Arcobacter sp.]|nr:TonB C-terminal domain-containing protein [Arcobacter sp.]
MQKSGYFYISGFLSFSIYLIICAFFLYYINAPKPKKFDSISKTTVLELEIISTRAEKKSIAQKSKVKEQEIVKKSTSKSNKQKADFKSLFANVKTKAKKTVEKDVNAVKASIDPSRFKSKFQKQKKTDNVSISKILHETKSTTNKPLNNSSEKGLEHEYFSKIKQILWSRWNPKLLEDGLLVKVLVMITNNGNFDYRIMRYSNDVRFDESLKEFLELQKNEIFPSHKINDKVDIIINFKSEG